ncbi:MAG: sigma-54 dependent transcriptional regulator, partial [Blastocatellia bacterium]
TGEEGLQILAEPNRNIDIALLDLHLPDYDGIELVKASQQHSPDTTILVITGYGSLAKAEAAKEAGAFFYLEKPVDFDRLKILLTTVEEQRRKIKELLAQQEEQRRPYFRLIGRSKAMDIVYETIEGIAESEANVLIVGESGTGKELVADAVHFRSHRARKPLMKVNCAALPKELIESELFGHTKGAFTGAHAEKVGLIGRAAGGSLFLDEISEMPLELQPKLLRVLQERVYYRVGSEKPLEADFRLIAATNRNPFEAIREGQLREDLYYRLNTIEVRVPPLRERPEDIHLLADHFRQRYAEQYKRNITSISEQAYALMFNYSWPGNVRELQNAMERAVLMCRGESIEAQHLPMQQYNMAQMTTGIVMPPPRPTPSADLLPGVTATPPPPITAPTPEKDYTIEELCNLIVDKLPIPPPGAPMKELFRQLEVYLAHAAVKRTRGNKQAAASLLGIYRPRLYNLLRKEDVPAETPPPEENLAPSASASV